MSCNLPDCAVTFTMPDCAVTFTMPDATACFDDATGGIIDAEDAFVLDETGAIILEN